MSQKFKNAQLYTKNGVRTNPNNFKEWSIKQNCRILRKFFQNTSHAGVSSFEFYM